MNNNSPEYDTISSAASSLGSANNVFAPNSYPNSYSAKFATTTIGKRPGNEFNNYEELAEHSPETEAKQLFGVPTRRSAIAPNLSQDDSNLIRKKSSNLLLSLNQCTNDRLRSLTRHNSLDKVRPPDSTIGALENNMENIHLRSDCNRISSTNLLLSPNQPNLPAGNHFNFGNLITSSSSLVKSKPQNINMAQRPLPSPPTEHRKRTTETKPSSNLSTANSTAANKPPPLNLNKPTDHCLLNKSAYQGGSLIKNHPIKSPSTASMLLQSPLDFEKAASLYLNKQRSINNLAAHLPGALSESNSVDLPQSESQFNEPNLIKPVRSSVVRTPALTINTCSSDLQLQQLAGQHHSPVPLLPPRTPVTSKPNLATTLNTASSNSNINHLNSYPTSGYAKMISSNPNLNYSSSSSGLMTKPPLNPHHHGYSSVRSHSSKPSKGWTETCIDSFLLPNSNPPPAQTYQSNHFYSSHQLESHNPSNSQTNQFIAFNKYNQLRENQLRENQLRESQLRENQFTSYHTSNPPSSRPANSSAFNHPPESGQSMLQSSNSSSILSNASSSSSSIHAATQVFQPFIEETKPYQLSDFYRYSTKYKNSQKNLQQAKKEINIQETLPESQPLDRTLTKNDSTEINSTMEESFFAKNQVASEFTNELKDWLKEKYDKTATLV